jgi:hypothetical protein
MQTTNAEKKMPESKIENVILGVAIPVIVYSLPICFVLLFRNLLDLKISTAVADITAILLNLILVFAVLFFKKKRTIEFDLAYFITQIIVLLPAYILCTFFFSENDMIFAVRVYQSVCILNVCLLIAFLFFRLYCLIRNFNKKNKSQKK